MLLFRLQRTLTRSLEVKVGVNVAHQDRRERLAIFITARKFFSGLVKAIIRAI